MKPASVRLSAKYEALQRKVFDFYGVTGDSYSDMYRCFLEVCSEQIDNQLAWAKLGDIPEPPEVLGCKHRRTLEIPHRNKQTGAVIWYEKKLVCSRNPPNFKPTYPQLCEHCVELKYLKTAPPATEVKPVSPIVCSERKEAPATSADDDGLPEGFVYGTLRDFLRLARMQNADGTIYCPVSYCQKYPATDCKRCQKERYKTWYWCKTHRIQQST